LRTSGKINEAKSALEKIMSIRPWSIIGSYNFNYQIISDLSHNS